MSNTSRSLRLPTVGEWPLLLLAGLGVAGVMYWLGLDRRREDERLRSFDNSQVERLQAMEAWIENGPDAVADLVLFLTDDDSKLRGDAALALARIGPPAQGALPALEQALRDPEPSVRRLAVMALGKIAHDLERLTPAIAASLIDDDPLVRNAAAEAIANEGTYAADAVALAFVEAPPANCLEALLVLGHLGTDNPDAIAKLRRIVNDEQLGDPLRESGVAVLAVFEEVTLVEVESCLRSGHPPLIRAGLRVLVPFGPAAATLVPDLIGLLEHEAESLRFGALAALADVGPDARAALTDVARLLDGGTGAFRVPDSKHLWRLRVLETWWRLGADRHAVVAKLTALVLEEDSNHVFETVKLLYEVSPDDARRLLPMFVEWVDDNNWGKCRRGLMGLKGLGPAAVDAMPHALGLLQSRWVNPNSTAWLDSEPVKVVIALGAAGQAAVPALIEWVERPDTGWGKGGPFAGIFDALGDLGPAASGAVPAIVAFLDRTQSSDTDGRSGDDWYSRSLFARRAHALEALRRIGVWNEAVGRQIRQALADPLPVVRASALAACGQLEPDSDRAVAALVEGLEDDNYMVRREAAAALGRLGPTAAAAVPALRTALGRREHAIPPEIIRLGNHRILAPIPNAPYIEPSRGRQPTVRDTILEALQKIEPETAP